MSLVAFILWQYYELRKAKKEQDRVEEETRCKQEILRALREQKAPTIMPASSNSGRRPSRHSVTRPTRVRSYDSGLTTGMALGSGGSCDGGGSFSGGSSFGGGCD
ncbi:hypothetical protein [Salinivibrio kushneri]|uniref:hypothetical protein n=1 Tax=Salinivibrio kushneri TaxID=1908198 RepID=UPI00105465E6|nr:hypothetical protein [Salinivibrio kushneri]